MEDSTASPPWATIASTEPVMYPAHMFIGARTASDDPPVLFSPDGVVLAVLVQLGDDAGTCHCRCDASCPRPGGMVSQLCPAKRTGAPTVSARSPRLGRPAGGVGRGVTALKKEGEATGICEPLVYVHTVPPEFGAWVGVAPR